MYLAKEMCVGFSAMYLDTLAQAKMVRLHFLRVSILPRFSTQIIFKLGSNATFSALLLRPPLAACHCKIFLV
jgi:hypothetical protein